MTYSVRYIRDHLNGALGNGASYWVEIAAYDDTATNIASGKTVTANFTPSEGVLTQITNDDTNTNNYVASPDANSYVVVDLGATYQIDSITRWHYYGDARTFYDTKTETSIDGVTWVTIFDSAVSGTYAEQAAGQNNVTVTNGVSGVTRDSHGAPLGSCTVNLFITGTDILTGTTTSDGSGNYTVYPTAAGPYYLVAYKAGSPDVAGTSTNDIVDI